MRSSKHLYLTGFRGTGKTSVGVILATALGRPVIDLDQVVEAKAGKSIREIFDEGGESMFRDQESEALGTVSEAPSAVISLGGGAILRAANREILRASGCCFWLDADAETIAARIAADASTADQRPPLTSLGDLEEIRELVRSRRGLYEEASDFRIDTRGNSVEQVAREIRDQFERVSQFKKGADRGGE